ncbi:hypothetical protein [Streptomyces xantholiticus]|uniref:hypothetical protein n=1 Tax=Streptomyces xantholiticus TaxID=68285 RepID=UPI00199D06F2|nr:hypothetical protein GCM10010381_42230 [Streptomyces xantholiticus]
MLFRAATADRADLDRADPRRDHAFPGGRGRRPDPATTDTVNVPTAAAFDRAGYEVTEIRLVLVSPAQ